MVVCAACGESSCADEFADCAGIPERSANTHGKVLISVRVLLVSGLGVARFIVVKGVTLTPCLSATLGPRIPVRAKPRGAKNRLNLKMLQNQEKRMVYH